MSCIYLASVCPVSVKPCTGNKSEYWSKTFTNWCCCVPSKSREVWSSKSCRCVGSEALLHETRHWGSATDYKADICATMPTSENGSTITVSWLKLDTRPVFSANNVSPSNNPLEDMGRPPVIHQWTGPCRCYRKRILPRDRTVCDSRIVGSLVYRHTGLSNNILVQKKNRMFGGRVSFMNSVYDIWILGRVTKCRIEGWRWNGALMYCIQTGMGEFPVQIEFPCSWVMFWCCRPSDCTFQPASLYGRVASGFGQRAWVSKLTAAEALDPREVATWPEWRTVPLTRGKGRSRRAGWLAYVIHTSCNRSHLITHLPGQSEHLL